MSELWLDLNKIIDAFIPTLEQQPPNIKPAIAVQGAARWTRAPPMSATLDKVQGPASSSLILFRTGEELSYLAALVAEPLWEDDAWTRRWRWPSDGLVVDILDSIPSLDRTVVSILYKNLAGTRATYRGRVPGRQSSVGTSLDQALELELGTGKWQLWLVVPKGPLSHVFSRAISRYLRLEFPSEPSPRATKKGSL